MKAIDFNRISWRNAYVVVLSAAGCLITKGASAQEAAALDNRKLPVSVSPMLIDELPSDTLQHAAYRRGRKGDRIVASSAPPPGAARILEWPLPPSACLTEVVPPNAAVAEYNNSVCPFDIDGDGIEEIVVSRRLRDGAHDVVWFKEVAGEKVWQGPNVIGGLNHGGYPHDIAPLTVHKSGRTTRGVVVCENRKFLEWFEAPAETTAAWTKCTIVDFAALTSTKQSGMDIGDIDGDGQNDVVNGMYWAQCPASPTTESWSIHRYGDFDRGGSSPGNGGAAQIAVGDMDGDGRLDIVAAEAEIADARLGIYRQPPNLSDPWELHLLETKLYAPHSIVIADVDGDRRLDIVVGEMTHDAWDPPERVNQSPSLYLYLNRGRLAFQKHVLYRGWGVHMMRMVPRMPDEPLFVLAADVIALVKPGVRTHVVGWRIENKK